MGELLSAQASAPDQPVLEAFDKLQAHPQIDGEGVQMAVDLDVALMEAGMVPAAADALTRDELARALAKGTTQGTAQTSPNGTPNAA